MKTENEIVNPIDGQPFEVGSGAREFLENQVKRENSDFFDETITGKVRKAQRAASVSGAMGTEVSLDEKEKARADKKTLLVRLSEKSDHKVTYANFQEAHKLYETGEITPLEFLWVCKNLDLYAG